jgi:hypothetical protein
MKLFIFGVYHSSPICRARYVSRVGALFHGSGPAAFVAVEAAPGLFRSTILPQRERFRDLAMADTTFTRHGTSFVETLTKYICFDADAHVQAYGQHELSVVWLDQQRDYEINDQGCSQSLGRNYYIWFKDYLQRCPPSNSEDAFRCIHSEIARSVDRPTTNDYKYRRDANWAKLISDHVQTLPSDRYALAAVGLDHTTQHPLSVVSLLQGTGDCQTIDASET